MIGIPSQFENLERMLDASTVRQKVIGQNIANVNTPGYHRHDVDFEQRLAQELTGSTHEVIESQPVVIEDNSSPERADGNNVDIDQEISDLDRNAMLHATWLQLMTSRISVMQQAIRRS